MNRLVRVPEPPELVERPYLNEIVKSAHYLGHTPYLITYTALAASS